MELSDQVISLEMAQKLKSLGMNKESLYCWNGDMYEWKLELFLPLPSMIDNSCPAFTSDELMEILPDRFEEKSLDENNIERIRIYPLALVKNKDNYSAGMGTEWNGSIGFHEHTAANALARLLIHCVEKGLSEVKK